MVKLPISDYVADYYKKQGIEFTYRQQARFCWSYNELLKDQLSSLKEILKVSDDEKLNTEIKERLDYEEKAYECFMTNKNQDCFYIVFPDNMDEYNEEYFSAAENAVSYGVRNSDKGFSVEKRYLSDKAPKRQDGCDTRCTFINGHFEFQTGSDAAVSGYYFTSKGDVIYGTSDEYTMPFNENNTDRFENLYLYIKSPFGPGDIVMGPDFHCPQVVSTDHDCFMKLYDRMYDKYKEQVFLWLDPSSSIIRTDYVGRDGKFYYDHTVPFGLWKIDSWEDKEYWDILQVMSKCIREGIDMFGLDYQIHEYAKRHR